MQVDNIKNYGNYRTHLKTMHTNATSNTKIFGNVQNIKGNLMGYAACASMVPFAGKINPEKALKKLIPQLDLTQTSGKITPEMITDEMAKLLLKIARGESKKAYPPFSNSRIGAVVLTSDGKLYKGLSVEHGFNAKSTSSNQYIPPKFFTSAEENALSKMIGNHGVGKNIVAIATATKQGAGYDYFPVLSARNLIRELAPQNTKIILFRNGKPHYDDIILNTKIK